MKTWKLDKNLETLTYVLNLINCLQSKKESPAIFIFLCLLWDLWDVGDNQTILLLVMFRTSVWMRTKRVFSWDDGMFNTVMAAGWQDWEWSMIRWRCFRSLINSTLSHSRRRIRPWTKYSVFVKIDKCICSDLRSVWSTLSEDTDLTLNILMPVIRHATQWYGPYHTAATRSVMTLSSDTMASRISDTSAVQHCVSV